MIVRDTWGIIVQHHKIDPNYMDGGDSACRTGIMALVGSKKDAKLTYSFHIGNGLLVRHPIQKINKNPNNFSRDQLIPLVAGMHAGGFHRQVRKVFWSRLKNKFFCQNTHFHPSQKKKEFPDGPDILLPNVIWHVILCGRMWYLYWLAPIGYLFQILDIIWHVLFASNKEQNQIFCMLSISGLLPIYLAMHPDFHKSMNEYWGGWRDQREIAIAIIEYCRKY